MVTGKPLVYALNGDLENKRFVMLILSLSPSLESDRQEQRNIQRERLRAKIRYYSSIKI